MECPKLQIPIDARAEGNDSGTLEDIEKVRSFWADLWEKSGNSDKEAIDGRN